MCIIFILFLDAAKKPATAAKIQLENASRDELVDFIKKQNQHIKTMETKSAGDGLIWYIITLSSYYVLEFFWLVRSITFVPFILGLEKAASNL